MFVDLQSLSGDGEHLKFSSDGLISSPVWTFNLHMYRALLSHMITGFALAHKRADLYPVIATASNRIQRRIIWRCPAEPSQLANVASEPPSVNNNNAQLQCEQISIGSHTRRSVRAAAAGSLQMFWGPMTSSLFSWQSGPHQQGGDCHEHGRHLRPPRAQRRGVCCRPSVVAFVLISKFSLSFISSVNHF